MRAYRGRRSETIYSQLLKEHPEQNLRFAFRLDALRPDTITVTIPENIFPSLLFRKASASDGESPYANLSRGQNLVESAHQ